MKKFTQKSLQYRASVTPLQKQYHCYRYKTVVFNYSNAGNNLVLDFKNVSAIVYDGSGMFKYTHFNDNANIPGGYYWVILKNGVKIFAGPAAPDNQAYYFGHYYREFIKNHPEFSAVL